MAVLERTLSRSGQLAIPRKLLRELKLVPPVKVQIERRDQGIFVRPHPSRILSDEEFLALLRRIQQRNKSMTMREVNRIVRQVRQQADARRH